MGRKRCAAGLRKTQAADRAQRYGENICLSVVAPLSEPEHSFIDASVGLTAAPAAGNAYGHVAEWLRSGLQNRAPRFNSGRGLQQNQGLRRTAKQPKSSRHCFVGKKPAGARFTGPVSPPSGPPLPTHGRLRLASAIGGSRPSRPAERVLLRVVRENDVSAMHVNHVVLMSVVARRVSLTTGVPYAVMPHGSALEYVVRHDTRMQAMATEALDGADRILVLSDELRDECTRFFPTSGTLTGSSREPTSA